MKSIEWCHGSSLIAFSVNFHGYKRLHNLILIFVPKHDVRNQFSWLFWWCVFLIAIRIITNGGKHSPPGEIIGESEGPPVSGPGSSESYMVRSILLQGTSFRNHGSSRKWGRDCIVKWFPIEQFSTFSIMIFDVDSNCVNPRSWITAQGVVHSHNSVKILHFL